MAVSVRMNPLLEKELELAARRRGITKSQFIIEAVERSLGRRDMYALMLSLQAEEEASSQEVRGAGAAASVEPVAGEFSYPVDGADAARAFIMRKLRAKHGGDGAG